VATDVGGQAATSNVDAVQGADMVVLAVYSTSVASILLGPLDVGGLPRPGCWS
jgi:predicted dinucleotide-binding enzyme